jgi:hypothetical protein
MTFEQALIAAVGTLSAAVVFMARHILAIQKAGQEREDKIHASYVKERADSDASNLAERTEHGIKLSGITEEFTRVLFTLARIEKEDDE